MAISNEIERLAIASGHFNPFHIGHLDMVEKAAQHGSDLLVIVNNDAQQIIKKGAIIRPENERLRIVRAFELVGEAILAIDDDYSICETLGIVAEEYPKTDLVFYNSGDREDAASIPEAAVCGELGIEMIFGGDPKVTSSTEINQVLGFE